jgi:hypothetical protein
VTPDLYHLPRERQLPASRYVAARRQLSEVTSMKSWRFFGRWRNTGIVIGLGVGLSVGGGAALAKGVFSQQQPGAPSDTQLGHIVTVSRTGTATINLGPVPRGAADVSLTLTGLTVGTFRFPDDSSLSCSPSDLSQIPYGCQAIQVFPLRSGRHTVSITTTADASWRLQATYINRVITPWKTNALGETYGVPNVHGFPDLIAVIFDNGGSSGFVKSTDMNCAMSGGRPPTSPTQALARQKALDGRSVSVPVYKNDGKTKIGTYYVGIGPHADAIPLSSLSCSGVGPVPFARPSSAIEYGPAGAP